MFKIVVIWLIYAFAASIGDDDLYTKVIVRYTHEPYHEDDDSGRVTAFTPRGGIVLYRLYSEHKLLEYLLLQSIHDGCSFNPPNGLFKEGLSQLSAALRVLEEETGIKKSEVKVMPDFQVITKFEDNNIIPQRNIFFVAQLLDANQTLKLSKAYRRHTWCWYEEASLVSISPNQTELYKACDRHFIRHKIIPIESREPVDADRDGTFSYFTSPGSLNHDGTKKYR